MFNNQRYLTRGVEAEISLALQLCLWNCIDRLPEERDYLQIFQLEPLGEKMQQIRHESEQPEHHMTYLIPTDNPITAKVYVIDDEDHSTMLLSSEY